MSSTFDTLSRALNRVQTAGNLNLKQKAILYQAVMVVEEMHSKNHDLQDVINHDPDVTRAARQLSDVLEGRDPK